MKNRGRSPVPGQHNRNSEVRGSSSGHSVTGSGTSGEHESQDVKRTQQVINGVAM